MSYRKDGVNIASRTELLELMFVTPGLRADEAKLPSPSGRPEQMFMYPHKESSLVTENGDHLYPKQIGTYISSAALDRPNPMLFASEVTSNITYPGDEFWTRIFSILEASELQPTLFPEEYGVYDARRRKILGLLEGKKDALLKSFGLVSENLLSYFLWLKNSGYDFVFGGSGVGDYLTEVEKQKVRVPGGRTDAIGLRLLPNMRSKEIIERLTELNNWKVRTHHILTTEDFIKEIITLIGASAIEKIDILEFKLGNKDDYNVGQREKHQGQVLRYVNLIKMFINQTVPLSGQLVYFGDMAHEVDTVSISASDDDKWIVDGIAKSRRISLIREAVRFGEKTVRDKINEAHSGSSVLLDGMMRSLKDAKRFTLSDMIVLSHFIGAAELADNSVVILLPKNQIIILKEDNGKLEARLAVWKDSKKQLEKIDLSTVDLGMLKGYFEVGDELSLISNVFDAKSVKLEHVIGALRRFGRKYK